MAILDDFAYNMIDQRKNEIRETRGEKAKKDLLGLYLDTRCVALPAPSFRFDPSPLSLYPNSHSVLLLTSFLAARKLGSQSPASDSATRSSTSSSQAESPSSPPVSPPSLIEHRSTTAQGLSWTFFRLLQSPSLLAPLRTEVDSLGEVTYRNYKVSPSLPRPERHD